MPVYPYRCCVCGRYTEVVCKIEEMEKEHPECCSQKMKRVFTPIGVNNTLRIGLSREMEFALGKEKAREIERVGDIDKICKEKGWFVYGKF